MTHTRRALPYIDWIFSRNIAQRRLVGGVAREHLVRQRQSLGRHHQCDHHLPAIAPPVAAVAVPGLGDLLAASLEVGAGQVIQQHVDAGVEQRLPPLHKMLTKRILVRQHAVQAAVQPVLLRHREVAPQQLVHRAGVEPFAVQQELRSPAGTGD